MLVPTEIAKTPQIHAAIAEVVKEFSPYVRHIRYEIAPDWTGDWTVFFRVLISDEAADGRNRRDVKARVISRMTDLIVPELGVIPHFRFRSESEQEKLNDPDWA
jgi:hypothetical protein